MFNQELQSTLISKSSFKIIHYGNIITLNYSIYDHKIQYFSEWHSNSLLRTIKNRPLHVTNIHSKQYVFTVTLVGKLSHKSLYVSHTVSYFYETEFEIWAGLRPADFLRNTQNLKKSSLWSWRLLSKSADLSKPWGRFFQILCVSQKVR